MRNDTILKVAGHTITLSGETRTYATLTIYSREYTGEVGNPIHPMGYWMGPEQWLDDDLLDALYRLPCETRERIIDALGDAMV